MNFREFELEFSSFINDNFDNFKRRNFSNSEVALKEFLTTEQVDTNSAIRNIMKKLIFAVRDEFVNMTDEVTGYELGEQFKKAVKIPRLDTLRVDFGQNQSINSNMKINSSQQHPRQAAMEFKKASEIERKKKNNAAQIAGIAAAGTIVLGTPLLTALTPLGLGTSLLIVGISAIVVGGIVYTVFNVQDESGNVQQVKVQQSTTRPGATKPSPAQPVKKTMDKASVDLMLDARKVEAELAVKKAIQQAEVEYKKIIAQLNS